MLAMSARRGLAIGRIGARMRRRPPSASSSSIRRSTRSSPRSEPIKEIASGFGGPLGPAEGPVWFKEGGYLLFSDINASKRMKYTPGQGVTVFQENDQPGQRAHPRPAGPPRRLRARNAARHPAGARRQPHRDRQQLPGPAPQPAERRRGQVRRRDLFHRSRTARLVPEQWDLTLCRRVPGLARSRHHDAPGRRFSHTQRARLLAR